MSGKRKCIHVHPSIELIDAGIRGLCAALAPVDFAQCDDLRALQVDDWVITFDSDLSTGVDMSHRALHILQLLKVEPAIRSERMGSKVRFGHSQHLEPLLRGRVIGHAELQGHSSITPAPNDEVLATYGNDAVWSFRRLGSSTAHIVSAPLPRLSAQEQFFDFLDGYNFIQLVPLLHFLYDAAAATGWMRPPIRACLMFDDPNLHWPSYGFLSYPDLVQHAKRHQYHVAIATVPLDAWGLHPGAIELFKDNRKHLSLLVHGNNHTRFELGVEHPDDFHLKSLSQGLRRIERLERSSGLLVDRVIVPPFEAISSGSLVHMLPLGYEGMCVSPWSLRHWVKDYSWSNTYGTLPAEITHGGFPVVGRFKMSTSCEGACVISAFLRRPIVLVEHHQAAKFGLDLLEASARLINSIGSVAWCSIGQVLRSNYHSRRDAGTLTVTPFASRIDVPIPAGVERLAVIDPDDSSDADANLFVFKQTRTDPDLKVQRSAAGVAIGVVPGEVVQLARARLGSLDLTRIEDPGISSSAMARRLICEARDRLSVLSRLASAKAGGAGRQPQGDA